MNGENKEYKVGDRINITGGTYNKTPLVKGTVQKITQKWVYVKFLSPTIGNTVAQHLGGPVLSTRVKKTHVQLSSITPKEVKPLSQLLQNVKHMDNMTLNEFNIDVNLKEKFVKYVKHFI